jgi:DNA polymerase-1
MNPLDFLPNSTDILVIDGLNLAFKSAYSLSRLKVGDESTGVIYGMLNSIFTSMQEFQPKVVFLVWEGRNSKARRKEIYPEYKEGRKSDLDVESVFAQTEIVEDILRMCGVGVVKETGFEADDSISALASFGLKTVIVSSDNDLLQLLTPKVSRYNVGECTHITYNNFNEQKGLSFPIERFVDFKVLTGDSSDNIVGVKGVGKKTADKLLSQYSLDEYIATGEASIPRTKNIFNSVAVIERNRLLIDLKYNQTRERRLELLSNLKIDEVDFDDVLDMLETYEMWTLLDKADEFVSTFQRLRSEEVLKEMEENV